MGKPVILAVDDDMSVLEAVVQDLRRQYGATYRVLRAGSGQAALDTCGSCWTGETPLRCFSPISACRE
jgi:CheY-like chemotaxis protein